MDDQDPTSYPLAWPTGWKRTPAGQRRRAAFSKRVAFGTYPSGGTFTRSEPLTISDGLARLQPELRRLGATRIVISSNLQVRGDGIPYAKQSKVLQDPGVAVYFRLGTAPRALACDKWLSASENMAAIAGHIEAIRAQGRYGVGTVEQAFAGYAALPPKFDAWKVLNLPRTATREEVLEAHRNATKLNHPDVGGQTDAQARINAARDEILATFQ